MVCLVRWKHVWIRLGSDLLHGSLNRERETTRVSLAVCGGIGKTKCDGDAGERVFFFFFFFFFCFAILATSAPVGFFALFFCFFFFLSFPLRDNGK